MGPPEGRKPRTSLMKQLSEKSTVEEVNGAIDAKDTAFDPCAEMLINDFDDERTLEEEEAMESSEDPQTELSDLQKEGDMPLSQLLAIYGYGDKNGSDEEKTSETDPAAQDEVTSEEAEEPSQLAELYPEMPVAVERKEAISSRYLRSGSRPQSEEEEDDGDYSPEEYEWKKTIMVGSDYQAKIPAGFYKYDDALPYENDDKILWDPSNLSEAEIVDFLCNAIPRKDSEPRDDEQALYLLLQCGYNVQEALRRTRIGSGPAPDPMNIWSEEECRNFETGIRLYGKDFHTIQKNKVKTRAVGELVEFYYLWKKTERHDVYCQKNKFEKKKFLLHPGITDYMDQFLGEVVEPEHNLNLVMYSESQTTCSGGLTSSNPTTNTSAST